MERASVSEVLCRTAYLDSSAACVTTKLATVVPNDVSPSHQSHRYSRDAIDSLFAPACHGESYYWVRCCHRLKTLATFPRRMCCDSRSCHSRCLAARWHHHIRLETGIDELINMQKVKMECRKRRGWWVTAIGKFAYSWKIPLVKTSIIHKTFAFASFFSFNQTASTNGRLVGALDTHALTFWYRIPNRYFIRGIYTASHEQNEKKNSFLSFSFIKFEKMEDFFVQIVH